MLRPSAQDPEPDITDSVLSRLARDGRVRENLAGGGRIHFDRRLPFLCIYRRTAGSDDLATEELIASESSFCVIPADERESRKTLQLVRHIIDYLAEHFGSFLIIELWAGPEGTAPARPADGETAPLTPAFDIVVSPQRFPRASVESLSESLGEVRLLRRKAEVSILQCEATSPPGMKPLFKESELRRWNGFLVGLAVRPIYCDRLTGEVFPSVVRGLRRRLNRALMKTYFTFARQRTSVRPAHYYALGRRTIVKAVWEVDRQLAEIDRSFDLLLQATPVNAEAAWREFRRGRFEKLPQFFYRPLAADSVLMKRKLYSIPVERVEDPTLSYLFRQKQDELDRKITLLTDVDTARFLPESLQIYGGVPSSLLHQATELLDRVPTRSGEESPRGQLSAEEFVRQAEQELDYYRQRHPEFKARIEIRNDLYAGMLVSGSRLLVGGRTRVPRRRVAALIQHEIGTHLVTHFNGQIQPFQQLAVGLAGYDGLQEGLAVIAEYLVGGLSRARIRVLAARVVAANHLLQGASFIDTFRFLDRTLEFSQRTAYTISMRTYRGGGLTKDAVYLKGLLQILDYLREGGDLESLYLGKMAASHLPLIAELRSRRVIHPPALMPRYLEDAAALEKIARIRGGLTVLQLVESSK